MSQPLATRQRYLQALDDRDRAQLAYEWRQFWARPSQLAPAGEWDVWLVKAGRGFGKTRIGSEWVRWRVETGQSKRIAIVNDTAADVRDVNFDGPAGLLAVCPPWNKPVHEPSKRRVTWPNGAVAIGYAAEAPDMLRGPEHDGALVDEPSKWKNLRKADSEGGTAWDNLMMGLRIGNPQAVVTTTPRNIPWMRDLMARPGVRITSGTSYENRANLSPKWFSHIIAKYEGTRLGRQELYAHLIEDVDGALWTRTQLEADRVYLAPELLRIVVAIDPAGVNRPQNAETGIVAAGVAGIGAAAHGYVLADRSGHYSPSGWATAAIDVYRRLKADTIIAEINNGGDMVAHTIRTVDPNVPVKVVHASRGKQARAEPVSALDEQHRIHHVGMFAELEDQMCLWDPHVETVSPDRVDARVWAFIELMLGHAVVATGDAVGIDQHASRWGFDRPGTTTNPALGMPEYGV